MKKLQTPSLWLIIRKKLNSEYDIFEFSKLIFWRRFFIIIFSSIVFLCFLSIISSGLLEKITNPLKFSKKSSVIIEIFPENSQNKTNSKTNIVLDILKTQTYIKNYKIVPKEEIFKLTNSFIGDFQELNRNIPTPVIIIAQLDNPDTNTNSLRILLSQKVNEIYVDSELSLLSRLLNPISTAKSFTNLIPFLSLFILISILFLIIYAILFSNSETIKTITFLGMESKSLSFEFAKWVFKNSLKAVTIGLILSIILLIFLLIFQISLSSIPFDEYILFIVIILLIPILSSATAMLFVYVMIHKFFR